MRVVIVPGPIARLYGGVLKMIGLTSFMMGSNNCAVGYPTFYTQLTEHLSWILTFSEIPGYFPIIIFLYFDGTKIS
jgi:hypothetical protein